MVLRIGRGELPAAGVAAIAFAVLAYGLDLKPWLANECAIRSESYTFIWQP